MSFLGFASPEKEKAAYRVLTNQAGTRQIRAHRSSGSTWLDFYERADPATPWRKQVADPSPATQQEFYRQLIHLGWLNYAVAGVPQGPSTGASDT